MAVELVSAGASVPLDREVHAIMYRLVQESLTNALKHAGRADTMVEIRYAEDTVQVRVTSAGDPRAGNPCAGNPRAGNPRADDPYAGARPGRTEDAGSGGAGLGLRGLRERVESRGGSFHAGDVPGAGFRVQAVLPAKVVTACP
jgi:signal transduction histidine kinase